MPFQTSFYDCLRQCQELRINSYDCSSFLPKIILKGGLYAG